MTPGGKKKRQEQENVGSFFLMDFEQCFEQFRHNNDSLFLGLFVDPNFFFKFQTGGGGQKNYLVSIARLEL